MLDVLKTERFLKGNFLFSYNPYTEKCIYHVQWIFIKDHTDVTITHREIEHNQTPFPQRPLVLKGKFENSK